MKKTFIYRKSATFLSFFFTICFVLVFMIPAYQMAERSRMKILIGTMAMCVLFLSEYVPEYLNRKIELSEEYCKFISFRVKRVAKPVTITTHYEDITYVKAKIFPFIGFLSIKIKISHYGKIITVSPYYTDRIEMISILCEKVQQYNPDAEIDPRLISYLERKKSR